MSSYGKFGAGANAVQVHSTTVQFSIFAIFALFEFVIIFTSPFRNPLLFIKQDDASLAIYSLNLPYLQTRKTKPVQHQQQKVQSNKNQIDSKPPDSDFQSRFRFKGPTEAKRFRDKKAHRVQAINFSTNLD